MKRAQMSEFLSIMVLIILLVVGLVIFKINSQMTATKQLEQTLSNYRATYILTTSTLFPYVTIEGEKLGLLIGRYACYQNSTMVSRSGTKIYFFQAIRERLDQIYDVDNWAVEINNQLCITSKDTYATRCEIISNRKYFTFDILVSVPCEYEDIRGLLYIIYD